MALEVFEFPADAERRMANGDAAPVEAPRPLRREPPPGDPFPLDALGDVLGAAARAIVDKIGCPDAIAATSVLAAASLFDVQRDGRGGLVWSLQGEAVRALGPEHAVTTSGRVFDRVDRSV